MRTFTYAEVDEHKAEGDCWVVVHNRVYDVSRFLPDHPGGPAFILTEAGAVDATQAFEAQQHTPEARAQLEGFYIGDLDPSEHRAVSASLHAQPQIRPGQGKAWKIVVPLVVLAAGLIFHYGM